MDTIANMLTQIRNTSAVGHKSCSVRYSKMSENIAKILKDNGFIRDYAGEEKNGKKNIRIVLEYRANEQPAIRNISSVSTPGRRIYQKVENLPYVLNGMGIAIVSTSKGLMTDKQARKEKIGGEVLCKVW